MAGTWRFHFSRFALLLFGFAVAVAKPDSIAGATTLAISDRRIHLGTEATPEWDWFKGDKPEGRRLDLHFDGHSNAVEATLLIRQDDVRQEWFIELNGRRLGMLFLMEADLVSAIGIPPGVLREGANLLSVTPPKANNDIVIHRVEIDPRPMSQAVGEATVAITVTDVDAPGPLPCRLTIVESHGSLACLRSVTNGGELSLASRPGVVYSGNGRAQLGLRAGDYTVYASRGFEWSVATQQLHMAVGQTARLSMSLRREVPTPGFVSCDTHVHTFTHSRHGDASVEERVLTLAGEGIELPIATDHNLNIDYSEARRRLDLVKWFTPVTGNEVTTPAGHFNLFPVEPGAAVPDFTVTDWPRLMSSLRATPGAQVVVLNHPRNVHDKFQPFAGTNFNPVTGDNKRGPDFSFDAMELINSSAQQSDYLLVFRDWFALLNHGYRVTAIGSSDSHDVSRYIVGQGRTYLECADAEPGRLDVAAACSNLIAGRALVSLGLLAQMIVEDRFHVGDLATHLGDEFHVRVEVLGPSWVTATNVMLFVDGVKIRETSILVPAKPGHGIKAVVNWNIRRPTHDVHLVAVATGPGVTAPFWAIPRPYQPTSTRWISRVIAATNPIWIDADGDGQFTSARGYARLLVAKYGSAPAKLFPALMSFDEAVAAQAASLCVAAGGDLASPEFTELLKSAASATQKGFASYAATLR
ncbi:MAG: hypothetical protein QOF48_3672 [Verrucomicrobiota bacterium]|jgi:hypothetical protein